MELNEIVVASNNKDKIKEIQELFTGIKIITLADLGFDGDIEETGTSFAENAFIKAQFVCEKYGKPSLADDSGLCVEALNGQPGIYSARYSGEGTEANKRLLLKNLQGVSNRKAYFACAMCLYFPDGTVLFGKGRTDGEILLQEQGTGGFGYDPLFYSYDLKKSFGLADKAEKNSVSHRYRALCDLRSRI